MVCTYHSTIIIYDVCVMIMCALLLILRHVCRLKLHIEVFFAAALRVPCLCYGIRISTFPALAVCYSCVVCRLKCL